MSIEQELARWDGKSASVIEAIYQQYCDDDTLASNLIELSQLPPLQKGTTWLIKHHLENSHQLSRRETKSLFKLLPTLEHWEAKLHVLQSMSYLTIGKPEAKRVETFLRTCLEDDNKFVRAWAYNGFYELARQYPEYEEEAKQLFEVAMHDEAASVKARIRNILKRGF